VNAVDEQGGSVIDVDEEDTQRPQKRRRIGKLLLTRGLKTVGELWQEYEHGIQGKKAAKLWSSAERGQDKKLYSFRLHLWKQIQEYIMDAGLSEEKAIKCVQVTYGNNGESLTSIIRNIKKGK
jgi:hypothetical protein